MVLPVNLYCSSYLVINNIDGYLSIFYSFVVPNVWVFNYIIFYSILFVFISSFSALVPRNFDWQEIADSVWFEWISLHLVPLLLIILNGQHEDELLQRSPFQNRFRIGWEERCWRELAWVTSLGIVTIQELPYWGNTRIPIQIEQQRDGIRNQ